MDTFATAGATANFSNSFGYAAGFAERRSCVVDVVMHDSRVRAVNYAGPTGGLLTMGEQCAYWIENCVVSSP